MTQPIDAQFNQDELSTNHKFNMIDTQSPHNPSPIQLTAAHPGPNTAGSDGSVNPFNGHRTYAYCIQIDGIRYSRATRYPPSTYSTSHRSKLEGAMTAATHHTYFTKKYHVTQATYNNIDWFGIGRACKSLPLSTNIQLTKMLNGLLNTGEQQAHMHQTGKRPCCAWP